MNRRAYVNRDKDLEKTPVRRVNPKRRDLAKPSGTRKKDPRDPDTDDTSKDKDLETEHLRRAHGSQVEGFFIVEPNNEPQSVRSNVMKKTRQAAMINNVAEFQPGDRVIQVYPVARPLVGVVTGANRVEGKVYVSWNGKVIQHDPEEIQLASCTPFFIVSRGKVSSEERGRFKRYVSALRTTMSEYGGPLNTEGFAEALTQHRFSAQEARELAEHYSRRFVANLNRSHLEAPLPVEGEPVVVLSDGGRGRGVVGLCVGRDPLGYVVVDLHTDWTSRRDGSRLVHVPAVTVVPVSSPMRENLDRSEQEKKPEPQKRVLNERVLINTAKLGFEGEPKRLEYECSNGKAWVELVLSQETINKNLIVIVAAFGELEEAMFPLFEQWVELNVQGNKTDLNNSLQRARSLIENANAAALQFVRERLDSNYVVDNAREFIDENKGARRMTEEAL